VKGKKRNLALVNRIEEISPSVHHESKVNLWNSPDFTDAFRLSCGGLDMITSITVPELPSAGVKSIFSFRPTGDNTNARIAYRRNDVEIKRLVSAFKPLNGVWRETDYPYVYVVVIACPARVATIVTINCE
jgi:hypothetical protein